MPPIKRRHFLQFAGSTLAAIGLSQADFFRQADNYGRVLAQGTCRKLALLIGINDYAPAGISSLNGCLTDVELQEHLLRYRFGFDKNDIKILTNREATRRNIIAAFEEHLVKQAKPGDVVVFHFSGHGSRVRDKNPVTVAACGEPNTLSLNGTLVPNDPLPANQQGSEIIVPDIMGRTLFLLMEQIQTNNLTVILDSCFAGAGTRGTVTVRSAPTRLTRSGQTLVASSDEYQYQEKLLSELGWGMPKFLQERANGIARGAALGSASCNQEALDALFGDFHAGAFTYLLTRYLWQLPSQQSFTTVQTNLRRSTRAEASLKGFQQDPILEVEPGTQNAQKPFYFIDQLTTPPADAVITNVSGDQVEFWLGGMAAQNMTSPNTIFSLLDQSGRSLLDSSGKAITLQQDSRAGNSLVGRGKMLGGSTNTIQPGMFLQEQVVGMLANPELVVGLDPSLGSDMEAARIALATILRTGSGAQAVSRIKVQPLNQQTGVDCILGRMTEETRRQLTGTNLPPAGVVALFTPTLAFIPRSEGRIGEEIGAAVNRLQSRFRSLLASKVLRAIASTASDLKITGEILPEDGPGPRIPISSRGIQQSGSSIPTIANDLQPFRAGQNIQIKVTNQDDKPLYLSCLAINSQGEIVTLHPANWDSPDDASRINRSEELRIPGADAGVELKLSGSGFIELITLLSTEPLRGALKVMQNIARGQGRSRGAVAASDGDPLSLMDDLLGDLDNNTRSGDAGLTLQARGGERSRSSRTLAAFSTLIEVKEFRSVD